MSLDTVNVLKFLTFNFSFVQLKSISDNMLAKIANSEDPDQTALQEQSDMGLHCMPRPFCSGSLG